MPRTMCLTSASGCSSVGAADASEVARRAQSVLDLVVVEICFTARGFAEGDDADFMFGLRVNDGHRNAREKAKGFESLLAIGKAIVFERKGCTFKHARRVHEVEPVLLDVDCALALRPSELHLQIVDTIRHYRKQRPGGGDFGCLTFEVSRKVQLAALCRFDRGVRQRFGFGAAERTMTLTSHNEAAEAR